MVKHFFLERVRSEALERILDQEGEDERSPGLRRRVLILWEHARVEHNELLLHNGLQVCLEGIEAKLSFKHQTAEHPEGCRQGFALPVQLLRRDVLETLPLEVHDIAFFPE